jgi:hypothetical protein
MKIGELIYSLGFESNTVKLDQFIKMIGDLNMSSIMAASGLGGLYDVTKNILESSMQTALSMKTFENVTGMSAQRLQSWNKIAEEAGVKTGALDGALKGLQMSIMNTKMGHMDSGLMEAYNILNQYGHVAININDDLFTQIDKIREGMKSLTPEAQRYVTQLLHQDESMLNLYKSEQKLYDQRNNQAVNNKAEVNELMEAWKNIKDIGLAFGTILMHMGAGIAKILDYVLPFAAEMTKALATSRALQGVFVAIGAALALAFGGPIWGTIVATVASLAYILSNWDKIKQLGGDVMHKLSSSSASDIIGLPAGVHTGLPESQRYAGPSAVTVNSHQYINGDDITAMKMASKEALHEALAQGRFVLQPISR